MNTETLMSYYTQGASDRVDAIIEALESVRRGRASDEVRAAAQALGDVTEAEIDDSNMPRRGVLSTQAVHQAEQALIEAAE